jgi:O-antigen/teichoic acid export membrane protein
MTAVLAPMFVSVLIGATAVPEATTYAIAKLRYPADRVVRVASGILLLYGGLTGVALALSAPWLLRRSPEMVPLLRQVCWAVPFMMIATMVRYAANGQRRFRLAHLERVLTPVSRLVVIVMLALIGSLTVTTAVGANIATTVLSSLVLLIPLLRYAEMSSAEPNLALQQGSMAQQLVKYGFLGWAGVLGHVVNYRLDQALLAIWVAPAQIGYYAVAFSAAQIPFMAMSALRPLLFAEASYRSDLDLVARASRCTTVVVVAVATIGILVTPPVLVTLFGDDFRPAVPLAQILLLGVVPFACEQVLAAGLLSVGKPAHRSAGQLVGAFLTVLGLAVLVPSWGVVGAAVTTLIAYSVNFGVTLVLFIRECNVPLRDVLVPTRTDLEWMQKRLARVRQARRGNAREG